MSHQCLKCGKAYTDSRYVFEGCPSCGGKSFYYTKKPLDENQRQKLLAELDVSGGLTDEKVEDIFAEIRRKKEEVLKESEKLREKVESIHVKESGEYEINVRRLMEEGSIIIYRDGVYYIYLPSLFTGKDKISRDIQNP